MVAAVEGAERRGRGRPYDHAMRNLAYRRSGGYSGVQVYIPAEVMRDAGYDPSETVYYRLVGHKRSANAGSVIVSLYRSET